MGVATSDCGSGLSQATAKGRAIFQHHCAAAGSLFDVPIPDENRPGGVPAAGAGTRRSSCVPAHGGGGWARMCVSRRKNLRAAAHATNSKPSTFPLLEANRVTEYATFIPDRMPPATVGGLRWPAQSGRCRPTCRSCSAATRSRPAGPTTGSPRTIWLTKLRDAQGSSRGDP